jgi:hypothetical protein
VGGQLLVDTDQLVILSAAGVLKLLGAALGIDSSKILRLEAAPFQLRKCGRFRSIPQDVIASALGEVEPLEVVGARPEDDELLQTFVDVPAIDPGEALLLAYVAEHQDWLLTTGDKRALGGLAQVDDSVRRRLRGKIITLESSVAILLDELGHEEVCRCFTRARPLNKTLQVLFSEVNRGKPEGLREALNSYWRDLLTHVDPDILYAPPLAK